MLGKHGSETFNQVLFTALSTGSVHISFVEGGKAIIRWKEELVDAQLFLRVHRIPPSRISRRVIEENAIFLDLRRHTESIGISSIRTQLNDSINQWIVFQIFERLKNSPKLFKSQFFSICANQVGIGCNFMTSQYRKFRFDFF